jgi:large conductance mechanosensitive channel
MSGFIQFIRKQGVVGLAVGFILGGAVAKFVTAIVTDIINPLLGLLLSKAGNLKDATWTVGSAVVRWGDLVSAAIDFVIIAAVVYLGVHVLGLDRLDHKDEPAA